MFNNCVPYTPITLQCSSSEDEPDGRLRIGYVVLICESVVARNSKLQPSVILSSMEAEYMGLCVATQEGMVLRNILTELFISLQQPTSMMEDNEGCIFATNSITTSKSKHINVDMHFV